MGTNQTSSVPFHRLPDLDRLRQIRREIGQLAEPGDTEHITGLRREYNRLAAHLRRTAALAYPELTPDSLDHLVVYHVLHGSEC